MGGFDLGLERTGGFEVKWQVEIDDYCRRVLEKHWPHVKRYGDIRTVTDVERVDVLCGGFPCQDISNAGKRAGIDGERSGLWSEFVRLIRLVRPQYVIVENVAALLGRGMGRVLGDLSESGYDAEWDVIPASAVGAPHRRERVWIVGHANGTRWQTRKQTSQAMGHRSSFISTGSHAGTMADTDCSGLSAQHETRNGKTSATRIFQGSKSFGISAKDGWQQWAAEPNVGRVAHGIPARVHRLKSLGNAVVPQIVEWIGNQILAYERMEVSA